MIKITNAAGRLIDFDAAANMMDNEISKSFGHGANFQTEQDFFDTYCVRHREVFGEEFEANKANPVW